MFQSTMIYHQNFAFSLNSSHRNEIKLQFLINTDLKPLARFHENPIKMFREAIILNLTKAI